MMALLKTSGADLVDGNGNHVQLRGFNWFGFNSGTTMVNTKTLKVQGLKSRSYTNLNNFVCIIKKGNLCFILCA